MSEAASPIGPDDVTGLPVLDLSLLDDPGTAGGFVDALRAATRDWGFFYVVGHGIPEQLQTDLIAVARDFFALPTYRKNAIHMVNSPHFRGYTGVGNEITRGAPDLREQLDIGAEQPAITGSEEAWTILVGPNQWPSDIPEFEPTVQAWRAECERVARTLMGAWLTALGQDDHSLDAAFDPPSELIKVVRYPQVDPGGAEQVTGADGATFQGVGAHKDSGMLTLVFVEPGKAGLQVDKDGQWLDATPLPGAFIVNIGELLESLTNGYLKATTHRVVSPTDGDRISVPYFFNPGFGAHLQPWTLPEAYAAAAPGVTQDPLNPIHANQSENYLKSRLRSHPDVAARHHPDLIGRYDLDRG
ncbi:MAG: isopenicillin N synthase family dioxygenase [Nostocoides sp.]